ncbi:uncharacterized protein C8Q71DRAFT_724058 [Rhodofomes roseus]|uniref:Ribonuclease H1 N-terminal domain-containing protein n=1 Tax=Rhodofomes roseus TaxID=34475 RepID=A0ABQ8KFQ4_9APHY|nr:uncharacterized protein C8Q71DRAFT_724058 [Rhodofomes roseus]KAH9836220.1 hypothetical protein C8Q71DRAFT_724058 [Rhodofomes roseus]
MRLAPMDPSETGPAPAPADSAPRAEHDNDAADNLEGDVSAEEVYVATQVYSIGRPVRVDPLNTIQDILFALPTDERPATVPSVAPFAPSSVRRTITPTIQLASPTPPPSPRRPRPLPRPPVEVVAATASTAVTPASYTPIFKPYSPKVKTWYVIWKGIRVGIFTSWGETSGYVLGVSRAAHKSFSSYEEAVCEWEQQEALGGVMELPGPVPRLLTDSTVHVIQ